VTANPRAPAGTCHGSRPPSRLPRWTATRPAAETAPHTTARRSEAGTAPSARRPRPDSSAAAGDRTARRTGAHAASSDTTMPSTTPMARGNVPA
jgi:hypothetical protein